MLTCHGLGWWEEGVPIYNAGVMAAFARAQAVICLNRDDEHTLGHLSPPMQSVYCIPHAVDPEVFTLRPPRDPRAKLVIGRVGRAYREADDPETGVECKGRATLHEIMRGLVPHRDHIKWLFVGHGWGDDAGLARELGFEAEFRVRGDECPYPEGFVQAYHEMDVYLSTSRAEGGPASLPEALACGVWPVCTPAGMCADLLPPDYRVPGIMGFCGTYGDLYPVNDAAQAVDLIAQYVKPWARGLLLDGWVLRKRVEQWTWPLWADAHLDVYRAVANG